MVEITFNGHLYSVEEGSTVLAAAQKVGVPIPYFCNHPLLKPAGLCRMCLVEIRGFPKLQTACTTAVKEGMEVLTETESVKQARREILEFHFAQHPLDCPECDQAGACLLQEWLYRFGFTRRRFYYQRDRKEKLVPLGKNLLLDRERCILCLRCLRFCDEVLGRHLLAVTERGSRSCIATAGERRLETLYNGNLAQICPVGAILEKDMKARVRNWLVQSRPTGCPLCSRGCALLVDTPKEYPYLAHYPRLSRVQADSRREGRGGFICDIGRYTLKSLEENRLSKILQRGGEIDEARMRALLKEKLAVIETVVLSSWLSLEEIDEALLLFRDRLKLRILSWGRGDGDGDALLIRKERNPNGTYLRQRSVKPLVDGELSDPGNTLLFGDFFPDYPLFAEVIARSRGFKALITPYRPSLKGEIFDLVVPVCSFLEKEGSYMDFQERRWRSSKIFEPVGGTLREGEILSLLDGEGGEP